MDAFLKFLQVVLLSSVKFVAGPPFAYYENSYDFGFMETILSCIVGGMLGVVVFTYLAAPILRAEHWVVRKLKTLYKKVVDNDRRFSTPKADIDADIEIHYEYVEPSEIKRRVFTKRNRRIVRIWKSFGLAGIALITPVILSIPIGTVVANSLVNNKRRIFAYMFLSIVFWSLLMTSIFEIMHIHSVKDLKEQVIPK